MSQGQFKTTRGGVCHICGHDLAGHGAPTCSAWHAADHPTTPRLTRPFAATVRARALADPEFAQALAEEGGENQCGPDAPVYGAPQTADPRIDRVARVLFVRHYTLRDDASEEWATQFWDWAVTEEHKGDCPQAQHKGPITCSACIVDEWRADARAVMGAL